MNIAFKKNINDMMIFLQNKIYKIKIFLHEMKQSLYNKIHDIIHEIKIIRRKIYIKLIVHCIITLGLYKPIIIRPTSKKHYLIFWLKAWRDYIKNMYLVCIQNISNFCIFYLKILLNFCINIYIRIIFRSKQKIKNFSEKKRYILSIFLEHNTTYQLIIYKKFLTKLFSIEEENKTLFLINNIAFNRAMFMKILAQKLVYKNKSLISKNILIVRLNFSKIFNQKLKEFIIFYHLSIKITNLCSRSNSILFVNYSIQIKVLNKHYYLTYILKLYLNDVSNKYNCCKLVLGTTKSNFQKQNKIYRNQSVNTFFIIKNISLSNNLKLLKIKTKTLTHSYSNLRIKTEALNCSLFLSLKCFRYQFTLSNAFNLLIYAYKKYKNIFFRKTTTNVQIFFLNTFKILVTIYVEVTRKYFFISILIFQRLKKIIKTILYFYQKFFLTTILTYCLLKNVEKLLYYLLIKCLFTRKFNILFVLHLSSMKNEQILDFLDKKFYIEGIFKRYLQASNKYVRLDKRYVRLSKRYTQSAKKYIQRQKFSYIFNFYHVCLYIYGIWLCPKQSYSRKIVKKLKNFLINIRLDNKLYKIKKAHKLYAFSRVCLYKTCHYLYKKNRFKLRSIEIFFCSLNLNIFQNYIIKNKILAIKNFIKQKKNILKIANSQNFIEKTSFITSKHIFNLVINFKKTSNNLINLKNIYFNYNFQLNIHSNKNYNLFFIKKILQKYVLGQDHIIVFLLNLLNFSQNKIWEHFVNKKILLFYGMKNVGKTQVVKALAIGLFNSTKYLAIYNMFYYMSKLSIKFLIHEYYNIPKFLFTKNQTNLILVLKTFCRSMIYLKNIEKAHPYLLNIFINILKTGFFKDINNSKISLKINFMIFSLKYGYSHIFRYTIKTPKRKFIKYQKRLTYYLQRKLYKKKFLKNILVKFVAKMHKMYKIAIFKILLKSILIRIFNSFLLHFAKFLILKSIKLHVENNVRTKIICYIKRRLICLKFLVIMLIIKPILIKIFKDFLLTNITVLLKKKIKIIYNI